MPRLCLFLPVGHEGGRLARVNMKTVHLKLQIPKPSLSGAILATCGPRSVLSLLTETSQPEVTQARAPDEV